MYIVSPVTYVNAQYSILAIRGFLGLCENYAKLWAGELFVYICIRNEHTAEAAQAAENLKFFVLLS